MYEEHFNLSRQPFPAFPSGDAVFVGPDQEKALAALRKALTWSDAIVSVVGDVGVGKTVLVEHALSIMAPNRAIARIGRIPLSGDELLELLLTEFGLDDPPAGRVPRYATFRRLLKGWAESNTRVYIVVEDALCAGADAIAELEALTAACSGEVRGAQLILLGPPDLTALLRQPVLTRVRQRIRGQLALKPLSFGDTRAFLEHGLAAAGADVGSLLGDNAAGAVFRHSNGIPRLVGRICEAALIVAAEDGIASVDAGLVDRVAAEQLGLGDAGADDAPPDDDGDVPDLIHDTLPPVPAARDERPQPWKAAADRMRSLREKTEQTQPSLPIIDLEGKIASRPADPPSSVSPAMLEPRAPEKLTKASGPGDTQSIRALDDALRPDTQLLRSLDDPPELENDDAPVPLGLQGQVKPPQKDVEQPPSETLPTLSDSMRLDNPARQVARAPAGPDMPEITLDRKLEEHAREARERLAAEAEKAAAKASAPDGAPASGSTPDTAPPESTAQIPGSEKGAPAASAPRPSAEARSEPTAAPVTPKPVARKPAGDAAPAADASAPGAGENRVASAAAPPRRPADEPPLRSAPQDDETASPKPRPESNPLPDADRAQLDRVAARLRSARSLEDIDDDTAAETLFGEEFSAKAAAATAPADDGATAADAAPPKATGAALELEPDPDPRPERGAAPAAPPAAPPKRPAAAATRTTGQSAADAARPAAGAGASPPSARRPVPNGAGRPPPARSADDEASRRLEMVRKLNGRKAGQGAAVPGSAERIVLEGDRTQTNRQAPRRGPAERPIENEFGASMTQTLEALNASQRRKAVPAAAEPPAPPGAGPEPIENQFGLTMTQTLRAISLENAKNGQPPGRYSDDDDDDDTGRRPLKGLLKRFRRH